MRFYLAERSRLAGAEEVYLDLALVDQIINEALVGLGDIYNLQFVDLGSGNGRVLIHIKRSGQFMNLMGVEKFWLLRFIARLRGQKSLGQDLRDLSMPKDWLGNNTLYYGFLRRALALKVLSGLARQLEVGTIVLLVTPEKIDSQDLGGDWRVLKNRELGRWWMLRVGKF